MVSSFGLIAVTLLVVYVLVIVLGEWLRVRRMPRKPAFLCDKHGLVAAEHCPEIMDMKICGLCWQDRWKGAAK